MRCTGRTFDWSGDPRIDPAAIEVSGLWLGFFAINGQFVHRKGIKRDVAGNRPSVQPRSGEHSRSVTRPGFAGFLSGPCSRLIKDSKTEGVLSRPPRESESMLHGIEENIVGGDARTCLNSAEIDTMLQQDGVTTPSSFLRPFCIGTKPGPNHPQIVTGVLRARLGISLFRTAGNIGWQHWDAP